MKEKTFLKILEDVSKVYIVKLHFVDHQAFILKKLDLCTLLSLK